MDIAATPGGEEQNAGMAILHQSVRGVQQSLQEQIRGHPTLFHKVHIPELPGQHNRVFILPRTLNSPS
jgi:hypothetical protein